MQVFVVFAVAMIGAVMAQGGGYGGHGHEHGYGHQEVSYGHGHGGQGHHDDHHEQYIDYHAHPKYHFDYAVHDLKHHDVKHQWETRDGDKVKGEYSLIEADGTKRIVQYEADKHTGFNAVVKRVGHASHPENYHHHQEDHHQQEESHHGYQHHY